MNGEQLLHTLGLIDYELIEEAYRTLPQNRRCISVRFLRIAAVFVLVCGITAIGVLLWRQNTTEPYQPTDLSFFTIDGGRLLAYTGADTEVYIPESVTEISDTAFAHNLTVTGITIPHTTTNISAEAFTGCTNLQSITVAEDNPAFLSVAGVVFSGDGKTLITYPAGNTQTEYTVPPFAETIGAGAFTWNSHLKAVHIPEGVTAIRKGAFSYCDALETVTLPTSLTKIETQAFTDCRALRKITVSEENPYYSDKDGVLFADAGRILHTYPSGRCTVQYEIPAGTAVISAYAFRDAAVEKVIFPASIRSLDYALFAFSSVHTVVFQPDTTLLSINHGVFENACIREIVNSEILTRHGFEKNGDIWTHESYK